MPWGLKYADVDDRWRVDLILQEELPDASARGAPSRRRVVPDALALLAVLLWGWRSRCTSGI